MKDLARSVKLFLLCALASLTATAQSVDMKIGSDSLLIGQVLDLELSAAAEFTSLGVGAQPDDTAWVVLSNSCDSALWKKEGIWVQRLQLTRFDSGFHRLQLSGPVIGTDTLRTPEAYVHIDMPAVGEEELKDIVAPYEAPFNWPLYIALPLGMVLMIVLVVLLWNKWKRDSGDFDPELPQIDPRELALSMLSALEEQQAWTGDLKGYYTSVTNVLRLYLSQAFQIHAMEMTGSEIAGAIQICGLSETEERELKRFLEASDFAKYAKRGGSGRDLRAEIDLVRGFVSAYPKPEEESAENDEQGS